MAGIDPASNNM